MNIDPSSTIPYPNSDGDLLALIPYPDSSSFAVVDVMQLIVRLDDDDEDFTEALVNAAIDSVDSTREVPDALARIKRANAGGRYWSPDA